jgi:hypothetical protein
MIALVLAATLSLQPNAIANHPRPVVESITPNSGPPAGGTTVTIRGHHLYPLIPPARFPQPLCTPCPGAPPYVLFGGKRGLVVSNTDEEVVVKTPPSSGGIYDVEISNSYFGEVDDYSTVVSRVFQYGSNDFDKILVPIVADRVPGAFGSIWSSELVGRNDNDRYVFVQQNIFEVEITQPAPWNGGLAKTTFRPELTGDAAFLYQEHIDGSRKPLAYSLRVRDLSRQADSWGTEVPLIRAEDAFTGKPMDILNVPFEPESRITLRVYDLDGYVGGSVPVYIRNNESDTLLGSTSVTFAGEGYQNYPPNPGLAVIDVKPLVANASGVERLRIQVGEKDAAKRLWAMVSVTDLETQQVTVISPVK